MSEEEAHVRGWAGKLAVVERKFREVCRGTAEGARLPWEEEGHATCDVPPSHKVLYTELMIHHRTGVAQLTFGAPHWHGIRRVVVSPDKREAFDAGFVPSWTSCTGSGGPISYKTVRRVWVEMGFSGTRCKGKRLCYEFTVPSSVPSSVPSVSEAVVKRGRGVEPWTFAKAWVEKRVAIEERYQEVMTEVTRSMPKEEAVSLVAPWEGLRVGNSGRVLYMELMLHRHDGTVELTMFPREERDRGGRWHGIKKITVPADKRSDFDAGIVPSLVSCTQRALVDGARSAQSASPINYKTVHRIWRRSGFLEKLLHDGSLEYTYTSCINESRDRKRKRANADLQLLAQLASTASDAREVARSARGSAAGGAGSEAGA